MKDAHDLKLVGSLLESAGLIVERIEESHTKRCDLRAQDSREHYLIEVKGFHDDAAIEETLRTRSTYEGARPILHSNTIDGSIDDALKQLRATAVNMDEALWLIALIARSLYSPDVTLRQILGSLYGIRYVLFEGPSGAYESRDCLYFSHSAFFRHRLELDGAIVIDADGARLCINDHGRRVDRVKESELGRFFAQRRALTDAATAETLGFFVATGDMDRNDETAVLQHLQEKYGLRHPISSAPSEYSVMTLVPPPNLPEDAAGGSPASPDLDQ